MKSQSLSASIIIPARNAALTLRQTIKSILKPAIVCNAEIIIVNDGLDKATALFSQQYPVKVVDGDCKGIAAARNIGIQAASAEILILLDADCYASPGWLTSHLKIHNYYKGLLAVGGSICLDPKANFWARCDHYCSWYNVHPYQREKWVPNHPGANLSFSRSTYECIGPFKEDLPQAGVHEDFEWQGRLLRNGGRIRFQPQAAVWHIDRDDFYGFTSHNYRWGYNGIIVKSGNRISRFAWVYHNPLLLVICFLPFAILLTLYTIIRWLVAGKAEPLFFSPLIFFGRLVYATGMVFGRLQSTKRR